jgi:hypothetical protein
MCLIFRFTLRDDRDENGVSIGVKTGVCLSCSECTWRGITESTQP